MSVASIYILNYYWVISRIGGPIWTIYSYSILCIGWNRSNFNGSCKRDLGWDNYFVYKKENRWFIPAIHKTISEQTINRGIPVIEVNPAYTSQMCPKCKYIDAKNRDGENFKCLKCGYTANTDKDVATENIAEVAVSGQVIKNPNPQKKAARGPVVKKGLAPLDPQ